MHFILHELQCERQIFKYCGVLQEGLPEAVDKTNSLGSLKNIYIS